jgi:hypothetical protein
MSVIDCYYIKDVICLSELVSVSDSRGVHVEYLEISLILSKQQFMTHSQYFVCPGRSFNDCDKHEWLSDRRGHFK